MIRSQLLFRRGRLVATLAAVAVAVASFALLASASRGSTLKATSTVKANARPLYDILVRPAATPVAPVAPAAGGAEPASGPTAAGDPTPSSAPAVATGSAAPELRADDVASAGGGITLAQWHQVLGTTGVEVAAPIAPVGYVVQSAPVLVDLSADLDPSARRQVLRVVPTSTSAHGTTRIPGGAAYLYATQNRLDYVPAEPWEDGRTYTDEDAPREAYLREHTAGGAVDVCDWPPGSPHLLATDGPDANANNEPFAPANRSTVGCWSSDPGSTGNRSAAADVVVPVEIPLLMVAVDPEQEAALSRLDGAVTSGSYADWARGPVTDQDVPVLASSRVDLDETLELQAERLPAGSGDAIGTREDLPDLLQHLEKQSGTAVGRTTSVTAQQAYDQVLEQLGTAPASDNGPDAGLDDGNGASHLPLAEVHGLPTVDWFWSTGATTTTAGPDGERTLTPAAPVGDAVAWGTTLISGEASNNLPMALAERPLRSLELHSPVVVPDDGEPASALRAVGTFDLDRVDTGPALAQMPFDIYATPRWGAADDAARKVLGADGLEASGSFTGPVAQRPTLLTPLASLDALEKYPSLESLNEPAGTPRAPISMVRVRVAGAVDLGDASAERVRAVAERIQKATGLRVDIVVGSSATGVPVTVPAGDHGRPALHVTEPWQRFGVATAVVSALDSKSVVLAILVLVACALAVGNATSAAVRGRSTELGVLVCLGWPRRRIFGLVLVESLVVGAVAGLVGVVVAVGAAWPLGVALDARFAALAVPAALVLSALAALPPAWRTTRVDPAAATRPPVALVARRHVPRRVGGLSFANVLRSPGRTAVGVLSLALGVAAVALLLVVNLAFRGSVSGTVLGDAITVQVRTADYVAAGLTALLGAATVADVLYVNVRERSAELALLGAAGWSDRALARLVGYEAVVLGVLGALVGVGAAWAATSALTDAPPSSTVYAVLAAAAVGGVLLTVLAAVWPVRSVRRLPMASLLAEE